MNCVYFVIGIILFVEISLSADPENTNTEITTRGGSAPDGSTCYFPFLYNQRHRNECILLDGQSTGHLWCSTSYNFDMTGTFGLCDLGTFCTGTRGQATSGGTANGAKCCFPFKFGSTFHSDCISTSDRAQPDVPWCSTADVHEEGGKWGYCENSVAVPNNTNTETRVEGGNVADGTLCHFPFRYNGVDQSACVVGGKVSSRPWCGTEYDYDTRGSFGYCVIVEEPAVANCSGEQGNGTKNGNANGDPCCFPFIYNNGSWSQCITTGEKTEGAWCATTDHFDIDSRWGYCIDEKKTPGSTASRGSHFTTLYTILGALLILISLY